MSSEEPKVWFRVAHSANDTTSVTCSLQEGNLSVKWTVKCFVGSITDGVKEAKMRAEKALDELKKALEEVQ